VTIAPDVWRRHYPPGVPAEIDPDEISSLVHMFEEAVARFGPLTAFTSLASSLTFSDLDRPSRAFAAFLQNTLGVEKGDRVALIMPNILAHPVALFGALRAGATVVSTNPLYTARELHEQLADSGAVVAVVLENMAFTLAAALHDLPLRGVVVTRVGDLMGPRGHVVNLVVRYVKRLVPAYRIPGAFSFAKAVGDGARIALRDVEVGPEDLAFLQYTGGTTGRSKGAMLTHRNMVANVMQCHEWFRPALGDDQNVVVTALPLYHVFALTVNCLLMLRCGAHNLLILNPRDMPAFIAELRKHPFTIITGVNTLFAHMLDAPGFDDLDFSRLRLSIAGGMAAQRPVAERWRSATGRPIIEGYGLTEASPVTACNRLDLEEFTGGIGLPVPSTELAIRDADGKDLGVGEAGELYFRGPQVMRGYWNRPEETAVTLGADGFLATGDIGTIDADGLLRVVDRAKDTILVSGFNVYPNEVEEIAASCPGVREAACVGLPDPRTGETVALFVARSDSDLTKEALLAHMRENLTGYKVPHRIEFWDELPKTPVGKVLRRAIREEVIGS
jgi:long-chain acyl-CoA synthetase